MPTAEQTPDSAKSRQTFTSRAIGSIVIYIETGRNLAECCGRRPTMSIKDKS